MNFRLPFQISRVSAICQSSSPVNFISKFTPVYGNHVNNQKEDKQNNAHYTWAITNKCTYKKLCLPCSIYLQKAFIHNLADTEQAVKERVRAEQGCDWQIPEEPKLAFRQSSKIECIRCVDRKPCLAPQLNRPQKLYDDSKCMYKHKCTPDLCNINPPRMDDFCCLRHERKKLPCLPPSLNCPLCIDNLKKPMIAPPLYPPPKYYDPETMKRNDDDCNDHKCIRMDDVCGLKVEQKELPLIPQDNYKPCITIRPLTAPNLTRPALRYDPTCLPYSHANKPDDDDPLRRDDFLYEPDIKKLPPLPCNDCFPCHQYMPTVCPPLKRPKAKYDSTEMKYKHEYKVCPCDTPSLRRDNHIISVTLTRKKLPPIKNKTCKPCVNFRPTTAPELRSPTLHHNNLQEEQNRFHCIEEKCIRRDDNIKICRKCLPPAPISVCGRPGMDIFTPRRTPKFAPLEKFYDDTCCQYPHIYVPECTEGNPIRMDDLCYKIEQKKLPQPPNSPKCKPQFQLPKMAPPLCRPKKCYDDLNQKYTHPTCPEDPCEVIPRADEITGITDEAKCLKTYKSLKCTPCQQYYPTTAPVLHRLRPRYDDSCMLYDHKSCPDTCDELTFRRDHYLWEGPKKLPKVRCGTICCEPCQLQYPTTAPPLKPPFKLYEYPSDPIRIKECPPECPPRRDDLLCWKPKRKKLPSFKDCDQRCSYSTLSWTNTKNTTSNFEKKLFPQNKTNLKHTYSTNHVSNVTNKAEEKKLYKSKNVLKENEKKELNKNKTNHVQLEPRYYLAEKPTWKCLDISKEQTLQKTKSQKKYDYSVEKWLKKGAEHIVERTKSNLSKKNKENICNRYNLFSKQSAESECITPVKFTGYDTSQSNQYFCIKKNNKLQPLRIGSAFKSVENLQADCNELCKKQQVDSATCFSTDINNKFETNKITTAAIPNVPKKRLNFSTIIQEHIKQQISPIYKMPTSNFILRLTNRMRSALFQKISNFFKHQEDSARNQKNGNILKSKSKLIVQKNSSTLDKELLANVYAKYDIQLYPNKIKTKKNKPYYIQQFKNQVQKIKMDKPTLCCNSTSTCKKDETINSRTKNIKISTDQVRHFSTNSKGGQLCYRHIDISDDYIGKIYKVKLKKIGVKNLMLEKNDPDKRDEEPHTICYICKVVPRYQPIIHDKPPDIENVKINYYKEKRNTIE